MSRMMQAHGHHPTTHDALGGHELIVVSNRQPYRHSYEDGELSVDRPIGGLSHALDTVLQRNGGTWIAWGDGDADEEHVGPHNCVSVPPDDPSYTLKRVWLSEEQVENYYYGFSNRVLWPLCHSGLFTVESRYPYWQHYSDVNRIFADAVAERVSRRSMVWLQDYHLALAAWMIRSKVPHDVPIAQFWHIPWPSWDVYRACPHGEDILRGLLANDLLGFQTERYRDNFLECVARQLDDVTVDWRSGRVNINGSSVLVRSHSIGVETDQPTNRAEIHNRWHQFARRYNLEDVRVGVGVDRLDYTKGLEERLRALHRLWATHPEWRENFTYVSIGSESRSEIAAYQAVQTAVDRHIDEINEEFGTDEWQPIVHTTRNLPEEELYALYEHSDIAIVSSIRDGMNLVAQEYIAAQNQPPGMLVLGEGAGVHDRFGSFAVSVNPYEIESFTDGIHRALTMPRPERQWRMQALYEQVVGNDIWQWVSKNLTETLRAKQLVQ